jgi:addiction module RelE/StbE family toxin
MKLLFTHSSQRDLMRLRDFIAENNPQAARHISQRLVTSINRLSNQPEMGIDVEELPGTQDLITGDYVVRYVVLEEDIYILRIWHGKEDR